jgi:hypothetical protein
MIVGCNQAEKFNCQLSILLAIKHDEFLTRIEVNLIAILEIIKML